jgi:hypothetical protein
VLGVTLTVLLWLGNPVWNQGRRMQRGLDLVGLVS